MARPAKQTEQQRTARVAVRLTAAELAALRERVAASGLDQADYLRRAALAGRVAVRRSAAADPAVVAQLVRIGTNLNQIARTANTHGGVPDNLDQLCRLVEAAVMRAVGREEAEQDAEEAADGADDRQ